MTKKDLIFYSVMIALAILFLWQWVSKGALMSQISELQKDSNDLHLLSGIGALHSTHEHADVKVYINGQSIDFSQKKYQLAARLIHFEDGVGDVVHTHATSLTIGHLLKSLGMEFNNNCIVFDGKNYCNENNKKLKFYVNGQPSNEFDNYVIRNLDKILVSYGNGDDSEIQKQLASVTNLAPKYSTNRFS